jgi:FkbM family methyltransferase
MKKHSKNMINKIIFLIINPFRRVLINFYSRAIDEYGNKSYSQEGEDMVLNRVFEGKSSGFYVDVGAHHPRRFSNTCYFYKQGWSGINIEPNPKAFDLFKSERLRDVNLQVGVADKEGDLMYYYFDDPALNTFDYNLVQMRLNSTPYKLIDQKSIPVKRLDSILKKHLPRDCRIDFLTIDVEGLDFSVLKSNDWSQFRPSFVLVEALNTNLVEIIGSDLVDYMRKKNYILFAKTYNTLFFQDVAPTVINSGFL